MSSCQNKFWRSFIVFLSDSFHRNSGKKGENRKLVSCLSKEQTPSDLGKIEFYCVFMRQFSEKFVKTENVF